MEIRLGGLETPEVAALLAEHHEDMRRYSPPEGVHTLDVDRLRTPDLTFWSLWAGDEVLGCAALRELDPTHGELKSMRTSPAHRRRGVAAALLDHVVAEAETMFFSSSFGLAGLLKTSRPSLTRSTTGPARSSAGRPQPKSSKSNYARFNKPVLHRPVELAHDVPPAAHADQDW